MSILSDIIAFKKQEVDKRKKEISVRELQKRTYFSRGMLSLKQSLLDDKRTGIIAEFKRRSPSKGIINGAADINSVTSAYVKGGASALSILTDQRFFGGSEADLVSARVHEIPILRKDFIVDEYQLVESKAMGADVILLIAACLSEKEVKQLAVVAKALDLEVLLELHDEDELNHVCDEVDVVGINNRNLKTFEVDIERSLAMAEKITAAKLKIAESGISRIENIKLFREHGFKGFLIGEHFMKQEDPGRAFEEFVSQLDIHRV